MANNPGTASRKSPGKNSYLCVESKDMENFAPQQRTTETHSVQERHPDWPRLDVLFYFAPHTSAEDMKDLPLHLADADVLLYEDSSADEEAEMLYNYIAQPDIPLSVEQVIDVFEEFMPTVGTIDEPLIRGLYRSSVVASTIDIGRTAEEDAISKRLHELYEPDFPQATDYYERLAINRDYVAEIAKLQDEREDIMAGNFEGKMAELFETHPELQQKPAVKIVVSIGSIHTTLRHKFAKKGVASEQVFSTELPYSYDYAAELQRTFAYGLEPSQDLLGRALAEGVIALATEFQTSEESIPLDEWMKYRRKVVADLSPVQVKNIVRRFNDGRTRISYLDGVLKRNGYRRLPQSRDEMQRIIHGPNKRQRTLAKAALND